jgi:hypothetical protein
MIDHQTDEEMILRGEVSDEAVEAAALVILGGLPTLMHNTYCYACPATANNKVPMELKYGGCVRERTPVHFD